VAEQNESGSKTSGQRKGIAIAMMTMKLGTVVKVWTPECERLSRSCGMGTRFDLVCECLERYNGPT
jgi:hypothetical protein